MKNKKRRVYRLKENFQILIFKWNISLILKKYINLFLNWTLIMLAIGLLLLELLFRRFRKRRWINRKYLFVVNVGLLIELGRHMRILIDFKCRLHAPIKFKSRKAKVLCHNSMQIWIKGKIKSSSSSKSKGLRSNYKNAVVPNSIQLSKIKFA